MDGSKALSVATAVKMDAVHFLTILFVGSAVYAIQSLLYDLALTLLPGLGSIIKQIDIGRPESVRIRTVTHRPATISEPPTISASIPILGHLWGIFRNGWEYVSRLNRTHNHPLFKMNVPGYRVYVATTPEAVRAIYKNPKTMDFAEIQRIAMRRLFNYPEEAIVKLGNDLNGDGTLKLINKPGPELDEINEKGSIELTKRMCRLNVRPGVAIPLFATFRNILTVSISAALWGNEYPMLHDESLEADFWIWVEHFWSLLILPVQSITAHKGYAARERLWLSILSYTKNNGHRQASAVVSAEHVLYKSLGLDDKVVARAGTVSLFVIMSNTVMAGLWTIAMIFSRPELLEQIRHEVKQCTTVSTSDLDQRLIDTTKLKTECPLLLSTFRETLRHYMDFSLNRFVSDDTSVSIPSTGETYLLRKNSIVQIAGPLLQKHPSIWGDDTARFKPCRFVKARTCPAEDVKVRTYMYGVNNSTSIPDPARPVHVGKDQKTAFTAFGGANRTCPGRFFATHVISAFVALMVSSYDISGVDGGACKPPPPEQYLGHGVKLPEHDFNVLISQRDESIQWSLFA